MNRNIECKHCGSSFLADDQESNNIQLGENQGCKSCFECEQPARDPSKSTRGNPNSSSRVRRVEQPSTAAKLLAFTENSVEMEHHQFRGKLSSPVGSPKCARSLLGSQQEGESFVNIASFAEVSRKLSRLNSIGSKKLSLIAKESDLGLHSNRPVEICRIHDKKLKALCLETKCKVKVCSSCGLYGAHKVYLVESPHRSLGGIQSPDE